MTAFSEDIPMLASLPTGILALTSGYLSLQAATLSLDREVKLQYDLGNTVVPKWSNGTLATFTSNQTPAPLILQFDGEGRQIQPLIASIPEAEIVDLRDVSRGLDGSVAVCGNAYDRSGRAGFFAVFSPTGERLNVVRLYPYEPSRVAVDSDGTIWTSGVEFANRDAGSDSTSPTSGVVRHFERGGKPLGAFVPRSRLTSYVIVYGRLQCGRGRVGWYSGPPNGPGSRYFEILSDGTVREYPALAIREHEIVDGLALTDDGRTYVTINDLHTNLRLLSASGPDRGWTVEPLCNQLPEAHLLYGTDGNRLIFMHRDRFGLGFVKVQHTNPPE